MPGLTEQEEGKVPSFQGALTPAEARGPIPAPHLPLPVKDPEVSSDLVQRALLTVSSHGCTDKRPCGTQWARHRSWLSLLCLVHISFLSLPTCPHGWAQLEAGGA